MTSTSIEKRIWLFTRQEGASRQEFFEHYLAVHAPLALRCHQAMRGYTVNLADRSDNASPPLAGRVDVNAIAVLWTELGRPIFDSPADRDALVADHDSFLGEAHSYRVGRERLVVPTVDGVRSGSMSAGSKVVLFGLDGDSPAPPAPPDHQILEWVQNSDLAPEDGSSPALVTMHEIRLRSMAQAEQLSRDASGLGWLAMHVSEHWQLPRPAQTGGPSDG